MSTPLSPNAPLIFLEPREDRVNARVSKSLREAIDKLAAREGRSTSNYVEQLLVSHLQANGYEIGREQ